MHGHINRTTDANDPCLVNYSSLFTPRKIGNLQINNRLIMSAMGNALADNNGDVTEAMLDYYRVRARGGVGLVITQFAAVSADAVMPFNLGIYEDRFIPGLKKLVEAIHEQGVKVCIQLMHPGMLLLLFKTIPKGLSIKVPSITPFMATDKPYEVVSEKDIEGYIQNFTEAALRVKEAGADAVEIHACHGCLLSAFLSPAINRRTDFYGGNVENRTCFVSRITEQIRKEVGSDLPLIVRVNGSDDIEGGVTPDDVIKEAEILTKAGINAISISSGLEYWSTLMAPSYLTPEGVIIPVAEKVKKAVSIPVIVAGKISPELAGKTVGNGQADFIALGRPLLADPELPNKLRQGNSEYIFRCLYCNNCLRTSWRSCTINPFLYRESASNLVPAAIPKRVMIIGGGLAGLQAAMLFKIRGHEVSLFEKESELGGQWGIASRLPGKQGYSSIIYHLKSILDKLQVQVTLNCEITKEQVNSLKPDIAIVATGATPISLDIPGSKGDNVVQANDIIRGKAEARGKIAVIGGSILGMETAVMLAEQGKEVILVSHSGLGGRKGPDDLITFRGLMRRLVQLRIPIYLNASILEINARSLSIRLAEEVFSLSCDIIVLAIGVQPMDKLVTELKGIVPEVYAIGDCVMPGNAAQATFSAARLALKV